MSTAAGSFQLRIQRVHDYEFRVLFDRPTMADLVIDEPPPPGKGAGPNPTRLLGAAVGSCLSASLAFCLNRAKVDLHDIETEVRVDLERNDEKRLRVGRVAVLLRPTVDDPRAITECLQGYEDFCVVTQSVRAGLNVEVSVDVQAPDAKPRRESTP